MTNKLDNNENMDIKENQDCINEKEQQESSSNEPIEQKVDKEVKTEDN